MYIENKWFFVVFWFPKSLINDKVTGTNRHTDMT